MPTFCTVLIMKKLIFISILSISLSPAQAQETRVFSGAEFVNYSVTDISVAAGQKWSTERAALPGYFSAVDTATYTGCTNEVHIDGYIKKYGNKPFIFPIGDGTTLRTLEISAPLQATDTYATAWINGDPSANNDPTAPFAGAHPVTSVTAPLAAVSTVGQWDWQAGAAANLGAGTTGTGAGLFITVSIPDMTAFADASQLRLVGWNGSSWIDLSHSATANGNTAGSTLKGIMTANISAIGIGKLMSVLPLRLENFTASKSDCNTQLNWYTSSEFSMAEFIVEQSSDGIVYNAVTAVPAFGNPSGSHYQITVTQPAGLAYYRLKMKDSNGAFVYSPVVMMRNTCADTEFMQVFPNPVTAGSPAVKLSFTTSYRGAAQFMIFSSVGQQLISKTIQVSSGQNLVSTDITRLPQGTYFIRVSGENGKPVGNGQKFIKQ